MKPKNKLQLFVTCIFAMFCISAASAQNSVNNQPGVPAQSGQQVSKKQLVEQRRASQQTRTSVGSMTPKMQQGSQPAKAVERKPNAIREATKTSSVQKNENNQPNKMTQLLIQRKEAHDKGLPVDELNKAIFELSKPGVQ